MKPPTYYQPNRAERRLNRTSENVDPAWDDADTTDFLSELDLADAVRTEDLDW